MTLRVHPSPHVGADATPAPIGDRPVALANLATEWLSAEAASVREPGRIELVAIAAERATAYERALAAASPEDVRLAWEHAVVVQARNEVGSAQWTTALRVSELLRFEYEAARQARAR